MSEYLAGDPERQRRLRTVVERLHAGARPAEVKREFADIIKGASAADVASMEQALVDSGFPVEEIQRLCEVHVEVFETALEKGKKPSRIPGHPIHSFMAENRAAEGRIRRLVAAARAWRLTRSLSAARAAGEALAELEPIVVHYTRKENQLFPWLERHGFTGPSRVMWGKHDEVRALLKEARASQASGDAAAFRKLSRRIAGAVKRMIFMEEHILYPEAERRLDPGEWAAIRTGEAAIGWAWIQPGAEYDAWAVLQAEGRRKAQDGAQATPAGTGPNGGATGASHEAGNALGETPQGAVNLNTGLIAAEVLDLALRNLPVDVSVVDENDRVLYYSDSAERIFPRSPAVIGRAVQNCHPQKSVAIVEKILTAFKDGSRDKARFWIDMGGKFIVIEYRALRDGEGRYRGALEVSQDATELRALRGQCRLLDWE